MAPEDPGMKALKSYASGLGEGTAKEAGSFFSKVFPYFGLRKKALDVYVAEIEKSNLSPDMKYSFIANARRDLKYAERQAKIIDIAQSVALPGTDFSSESGVEDEKIERILDSAKFVSNEDIQVMWGHVLAGEFEKPGSVPLSVVRILSEMQSQYAKAFSMLCATKAYLVCEDKTGTLVQCEDVIILPDQRDSKIIVDIGLTLPVLSELEALGLLKYAVTSDYRKRYNSSEFPIVYVCYGSKSLKIDKYSDNSFPIGKVMLTSTGKCLQNLVETKEISGYLDALRQYYKHKCRANISDGKDCVINEERDDNGEVLYSLSFC